MKAIEILNNLEVIKEIQSLKGEVFLVGGIIRDFFLEKDSKDIDIIIRLIDEESLKNILLKHGSLASTEADGKTGASFGVFKFFPNDLHLDEPIDIALPRTERLMTDSEFYEAVKKGEINKTNSHKNFIVSSDHNLSIIQDLKRRDFSINSMAMSLQGDLIDPFNGYEDLKNKNLKATSEKSFSDDPLRIMRAIQFASRFNFKIDDSTWDLIISNRDNIKNITGERILIELDKIFFKKGDKKLTAKLLIESGLNEILFPTMDKDITSYDSCITREDFFFKLTKNSFTFKEIIKGDVPCAKGIDAIKTVIDFKESKDKRMVLSTAIKKSISVLDSGIINEMREFSSIIKDFKEGKLPKNTKELALKGGDLMEMGYQGAAIGKVQKELLEAVYNDEVVNTKLDLETFLKK